MSGWRDRLPGAAIRGEIAWLAERVEWAEEAVSEERWLRERNAPLLRTLEEQVVGIAERELERKGTR